MMLKVINLEGLIDYEIGLKLQKYFLKLREKDEVEDVLILLEHNHVFTIGNDAKELTYSQISKKPLQELKDRGIRMYRADRGGHVTYHGPGQLVAYPIVRLDGIKPLDFLSNIEKVMLKVVTDNTYKIDAFIKHEKEFTEREGKEERLRGVWWKDNGLDYKLGAIGMRFPYIKRSRYAKHGIALNVNTNLNYFDLIDPCGFNDKGVMSMEKLLGHKATMHKVKEKFINRFMEIFGYKNYIPTTLNKGAIDALLN